MKNGIFGVKLNLLGHKKLVIPIINHSILEDNSNC